MSRWGHRTSLRALLPAVLLPVVLLPHPASATAVTAVSFGGSGYDELFDVAASADGSMVAVGQFHGSMTVDATSLTSAGLSDVLVIRLAPDGSVVWTASAGGTDQDIANGVTALADGSAVVTGFFAGTVTFGSTSLTSVGMRDVFVARIGPDGAWQWATRGGGSSDEFVSRITEVSDGSFLVTGRFYGTATFGSQSVTSAGDMDVFVARIAADGTWRSATRVGGTTLDLAGGITALSDGTAIVVGSFTGTAAFEGTGITLTSVGARDVFVAKVAVSGGTLVWQWATRAGGTGTDVALLRGVAAVGTDGTTVVAGTFDGSATFGSLPPVTSVGGEDAFVARVRPDGTWDWVASGGGAANDDVTGIVTRSDGSAVVVGSYRNGSAAFGAATVVTTNAWDVFAASITTTGTWSWAASSSDPSTVFPYGVTALPDDAVGIVGSFEGSATFASTTLRSSGPSDGDVFLSRIGSTGTWLEWEPPAPAPAVSAAPVPATGPALDCVLVGPADGLRVACTVRDAVPDVDILWRATYNPVLASDGVTPGSDGAGVFSFPIPAAAAGSVISIELVDWLSPITISVAPADAAPSSAQGGPVPARVPAGDGGPTMPTGPLLLLLVGVGAFLSGRARASSAAPAGSSCVAD